MLARSGRIETAPRWVKGEKAAGASPSRAGHAAAPAAEGTRPCPRRSAAERFPNALDPYERRYDRIPISVRQTGNGSGHGGSVDAFTYTVRAENRAISEALPAPAYLNRMLAGAREAGLPPDYVRFLEGFGS